jgi:hypothetical protein
MRFRAETLFIKSRLVRARVRHVFRGGTPWLGYLYLVFASLLALNVSSILGAALLILGIPVTWACGLWVIPRGTDGYVLAMMEQFGTWGAQVVTAQRESTARNRELLVTVLDSLPWSLPEPMRDQLKTALEQEYVEVEPTPRQVYDKIITTHELYTLLSSILEHVKSEEENSEVALLRETIARFMDAGRISRRNFLDALEHERSGIAEARPPTRLREWHDAYGQLTDKYATAVAVCYEEIESRQVDSMHEVAEEVSVLWETRQILRNEMANLAQECFGDAPRPRHKLLSSERD